MTICIQALESWHQFHPDMILYNSLRVSMREAPPRAVSCLQEIIVDYPDICCKKALSLASRTKLNIASRHLTLNIDLALEAQNSSSRAH